MLTASDLQALKPFGDSASLFFLISEVIHGFFSDITAPQTPVMNFQQQAVIDKQIQFTHDDSAEAPSYDTAVTDGQIVTAPKPSAWILIRVRSW